MARQPRIEFPGAFYHILCRGDRREDIFLDNEDRELFLGTLEEACEKTGWRVHAWVLMSNHYHWLLETPEANLVAGMKWFQNTYTRRINSRHKLWGHVFGGRYKSICVQDDSSSNPSNYLLTLADYIHLNPVRAQLVKINSAETMLNYPWSSLSKEYSVPVKQRHRWAQVELVLNSMGFKDTVKGRRSYIDHVFKIATTEKGSPDLPQDQGLNSTLKRGWYWGNQEFAEKLEKILNRKKASPKKTRNNVTKHGLQRAEELAKLGCKALAINDRVLKESKGSDPRKVAIASAIKSQTTAPLAWIADRLQMKSSSNVSQQIKRLHRNEIKLNKLEKAWLDSVKIVT